MQMYIQLADERGRILWGVRMPNIYISSPSAQNMNHIGLPVQFLLAGRNVSGYKSENESSDSGSGLSSGQLVTVNSESFMKTMGKSPDRQSMV